MDQLTAYALGLITVPAAYFTTLFATQISCSTLFRKKIETQEELESIVAQETLRRGLDPSKIECSFTSLPEGSGKRHDDKYYINLCTPLFRTRQTVRHEIDHIASGDCDREQTEFFYYYFIAEPRATLYSLRSDP
ncbi:hypothetical protein D6774_01895 [Candidatus Woesearchaeota archaeon]|nr:MAG: hypothetical protein D6774_01895 [Candidatus Woesearchaeota archaeon]